MNESMNKKLSELFEKMDEKVLKTKLNSALEMLRNGKADDLAKKLNKVDKQELLEKLNSFDEAKLAKMNINKEELRERISTVDIDKMSRLLGEHGQEIIQKLKEITR